MSDLNLGLPPKTVENLKADTINLLSANSKIFCSDSHFVLPYSVRGFFSLSSSSNSFEVCYIPYILWEDE